MSLVQNDISTKGVDSKHISFVGQDHAKTLSLKNKNIVVISGAVDFITDGKSHLELRYGSHLMPFITGMGCS